MKSGSSSGGEVRYQTDHLHPKCALLDQSASPGTCQLRGFLDPPLPVPEFVSQQDSPLISVCIEVGGGLSGPHFLTQSWQVTYLWSCRWFIEQVGLLAHCLPWPVDLCLGEFYLHFVSLGNVLGFPWLRQNTVTKTHLGMKGFVSSGSL